MWVLCLIRSACLVCHKAEPDVYALEYSKIDVSVKRYDQLQEKLIGIRDTGF